MKDLAHVKDWLETEVRMANRTMDKWVKGVQLHPVHQLEWAMGAFEAGGKLNAYLPILNDIEKDPTSVDLEHLKKWIDEQTMRRAASPAHSTSVSSNLIETYTTAAYAYLSQYLNNY